MRPSDTRSLTLGPGLRLALVVSGPMNVMGALAFAPPFRAGRAALGLPEAPPFYLWLIAIWVLAFGAAYVHQGVTGRGNRGVLALGATGKASFGALLLAHAHGGALVPLAIASALPDLVLALWFLVWLWRTRR